MLLKRAIYFPLVKRVKKIRKHLWTIDAPTLTACAGKAQPKKGTQYVRLGPFNFNYRAHVVKLPMLREGRVGKRDVIVKGKRVWTIYYKIANDEFHVRLVAQ
ncbi:unnamed protein product [Caenorhabditis bovis]|uniref:Uncharacterized protein n=1 Tax=Caenorhabditis bovis TaxID=2654633 RepID=A0A8S1F134_9PELO|nr:unnamed protein product [Caenorhabditis bovis]